MVSFCQQIVNKCMRTCHARVALSVSRLSFFEVTPWDHFQATRRLGDINQRHHALHTI